MVQCEFIEQYSSLHHIKSRSEVIQEALNLLQQREMEAHYKASNEEIDSSFESANLDGLDSDEAW